MADILTQLQDCLDDLLTQMYASLNYLYTRHPYGDIPGQPSQAPEVAAILPSANGTAALPNGAAAGPTQQAAAAPGQTAAREPASPVPETPDAFNLAMNELAQGLVNKEQQIEIIISRLPGIGSNEADQERRLRELEVQLRQVEEERAHKEVERQALVDLLGDVIAKVKRVP